MNPSKLHTLTVDAAKAGQRVDLFIGEALGLSRARLKRLFEIRRDRGAAVDPLEWLRGGGR